MDKKILHKFKEMDNDERKKLIQLLQDRTSRNEERMDWMYKEHNVDNEEYLLGRKVDKAFIDANIEKTEIPSDAPGAIFNEVIARRSQLDMELKMKEDPLYVIRQQEMEAKRRVLENPLKLQKLKAMLEIENKKKHKKLQKREKKRSNSSSDEETDELLKKYLTIKKTKESSRNVDRKVKEHRSRHSKEGRDRDEIISDERRSRHSGESRRHDEVKLDSNASRDYSSDEDRPRKQIKYGLEIKSHHSDSIHHKKVDYSNISGKKPIQELPKRRKLTESEKEEMRRQMMANAKETELKRHTNLRKYVEDSKKEKETTLYADSLLDPMITNMVSNSSVEDRIKRNRHTVQKSRDDYQKNFAKR